MKFFSGIKYPYFPQVMSLAWPAIVSNITTPLLSLVDMAIIGHLPDDNAIAAVAVGGTAFNMIYWLFGFLRMGTSGMTSQALGRGDTVSRSAILYRAILIALCASMLMIMLTPFFGRAGLQLIDPQPDTLDKACLYFNILVWGAPAVLVNYSLSGWFIGMQSSKSPMVMALVTNIVNIAVSLIAVYVLELGISGVAVGTLIAQWSGMIAGLVILYTRFKPQAVGMDKIADRKGLAGFFSVNVFIFLRTLCLVAVTVWFTRAGAMQNALVLSANAVLLQFFMLYSYFIDGFAFAGEAIAGRLYGAKRFDDLHEMTNTLLKTGAALALLFTLLYFIGGEYIITLLTDRDDVVNVALEYLPWVFAIPTIGMTAFVFDGIFIGVTHTGRMFVSILVATTIYFSLYFIFKPMMGNHALWLAFISYLGVRGGMLWCMFRHIYSEK